MPPDRSATSRGSRLQIHYLQPFHFPADHAHSIQILATCRALAEAGCRVRLDVKRSRDHPVDSVAEGLLWYGIDPHPRLDVRFLPTDHGGLQGLAARWRVRRARGEQGKRLVFYARHLRLAETALRSGRGPVFLELHALDPAARALAARVDGVVCITPALAAAVGSEWGIERPTFAIPDAVDLARFRPPERSGPPRLVYTGQLHDWKGVEVLLDALASLPAVTALIVGGRRGDDPRRDALIAHAHQRGVSDRVEWIGFVPQAEIPGHFRRGDIGVVPTLAAHGQDLAASPLKLFEYLGCELPVVASALPAFAGVLGDGDDALLFREGDADALARAIRRLLDDAALAARIARSGRKTAETHTWQTRASAILGCVEASLDAPSGVR